MEEERKRLRLSKVSLAEACGVRREMIGRYEKGEASPGAEVLTKLLALGADVAYILTGKPPASVQNGGYAPSLPAVPLGVGEAFLSSADEMELVRWFRGLNDTARAGLLLFARHAVPAQPALQQFNGHVTGQVSAGNIVNYGRRHDDV